MSTLIIKYEGYYPYENRYLLADKTGKLVSGFDYDYIWTRDEFFIAKLVNGKSGVLDANGKVLIPFDYQSISYGNATFHVVKDNKGIYLNSKNEIVDASEMTNSDKESLFSQTLKQLKDSGVYKYCEAFYPDYIQAHLPDNSVHVFNVQGLQILKRTREREDVAFNTYYIARAYGEEISTKVYDTNGKCLIEVDELQAEESWGKVFYDYRAHNLDQLIWAKKEGKYGFLTTDFKVAIPFQYEDCTIIVFERGFVKKEGIWHLINEKGEIIRSLEKGIKPHWYGSESQVGHYYSYGVIPIINTEELKGLLHRDGEIILNPIAKHISKLKQNYYTYQTNKDENVVAHLQKGQLLSEENATFELHPFEQACYIQSKTEVGIQLLNAEGKTIFKNTYKELGYINELGYLSAQDLTTNLWGVIDLQETIIVPFQYQRLPTDRYGLRNGYWIDQYGTVCINLETGLKYTVPNDFKAISEGNHDDKISVEFGAFGYGKILIDKFGQWYEKNQNYQILPIPQEKLHTYALTELVQLIENKSKLDAKLVTKLFKSVYYWHQNYWDLLTPYIQTQNLFIVTTLLEIAVKKAYGKMILAGGVVFVKRGLELIQQFAPEQIETVSASLLELAKKEDKRKLVAEAISNILTQEQKQNSNLVLEQPKISHTLRYTKEVWESIYPQILQQYPKFQKDLDALKQLLTKNIREEIEQNHTNPDFIKQWLAIEKTLEKIAKELKTDTIKEIRDTVVVFRAWCQKRHLFEDAWLNPSASEKELQELQDLIAVPLPLSFVESYRLYNGIDNKDGIRYMNGSDLLFSPIKEVINCYYNFVDYATNFISDQKRKENYDDYVKLWVPIFNSNGNAWVLNLGPTLYSKYSNRPILTGSIFDYNHEDGDLEELKVVYSSFKRLIEDLSSQDEASLFGS